jgi:hypothetical protein
MRRQAKERLSPRSHLFTVRLWTEALDEGRVERRGRVQHLLSGERRFFRDWSTLVGHLEAKLQELDEGDTTEEESG